MSVKEVLAIVGFIFGGIALGWATIYFAGKGDWSLPIYLGVIGAVSGVKLVVEWRRKAAGAKR